MGLSEENLTLLLFYSISVGIFLGLLWDFFRIFRIIFYGKPSSVLPSPVKLPATEKDVRKALSFKHTQKFFSPAGITVLISDLIFCITATFSVIILLFHLNGGEVRAFALFGAGIGFTSYYFTVGKITVKISDAIIRRVKKMILFLYSKIIAPTFLFLFRPVTLLLLIIKKKLDKIKNKIKINKQSKNSHSEGDFTENNCRRTSKKTKKDVKNERNRFRRYNQNSEGAVLKSKRISSRRHRRKHLQRL